MSLTKVDYYKRGQHNSAIDRGEGVEVSGGRWPVPPAGTWQRKAFDEGHDAPAGANAPRRVTASAAAKSAAAAILHPSDEYFKTWPAPAREHVRRLAYDVADEEDDARRTRLMKAIARVCRRHETHRPYQQRI